MMTATPKSGVSELGTREYTSGDVSWVPISAFRAAGTRDKMRLPALRKAGSGCRLPVPASRQARAGKDTPALAIRKAGA
eukprot:1719439-Alexandrium_andersonii.AAC.1